MTTKKPAQTITDATPEIKPENVKTSRKAQTKTANPSPNQAASVLVKTAKKVGGALGKAVGTVKKVLTSGAEPLAPDDKIQTTKPAAKKASTGKKTAAGPATAIVKSAPKKPIAAKK